VVLLGGEGFSMQCTSVECEMMGSDASVGGGAALQQRGAPWRHLS
jgi:hypothetical protein